MRASCTKLDISICAIFLLTSGFLFLASYHFQGIVKDGLTPGQWLPQLLMNVAGYSVLLVPGYLLIKFIFKKNYADQSPKGILWPLIKACVYGPDDIGLIPVPTDPEKADKLMDKAEEVPFLQTAGLLLCCFTGLQFTYLVWGLLQEKIMTRTYEGQSFRDSQFLVFVNRVLALVISWGYLTLKERGRSREAPLYKYSYCAFSNIMSSWFQYEALKFVSFPTQVLAKACKIIPVMLMGKVVSRKTYEFYEYFTASLISIGMIMFLSGSPDAIKGHGHESPTAAGVTGLVILVSYMVFDSFTSNWQDQLFKSYKMSSVRMMAGVNLFSCILTGISLVQQGTLLSSLHFMSAHSQFLTDCVVLSICSAIGQLFIYFTIGKFGAVMFVIIMTVRQALAVLLSCIYYGHPVSALGLLGVMFVFFSVFLRIYCSYRMRQIRTKSTTSSLSTTKV